MAYQNNYSGGGYNNRNGQPRNNGYQGGNNFNQKPQESIDDVFNKSNYINDWIIEGADEKLPDFAEIMGKYMAKNGLTNSKIRSIYGEIKRIQMGEFEKEKTSFYLLKPKVAYALGRDPQNKGLQMFKKLFDETSKDVKDQKSFINFCNLTEAVLAYHKANGGKD